MRLLAILAITQVARAHALPMPATFPPRVALETSHGPLCGYEFGSSGGPTFVYLHGGPGYRSADFVRSLAPLLARHGRVVAFDQRGSGCSPRAEADFSIDQQVEDVASLIRNVGAGPIILIGHSYGGLLALHVAVAHPELLSKLVLIDAPLDLDHALHVLLERCGSLATQQGRGADAAALLAAKQEPNLLAEVAVIGAHGSGCTKDLLVPPGHHPTEEEVERLDAQDGYTLDELRNDGRLFQAAFSAWPARLRLSQDALRGIRVPVDVIWAPMMCIEMIRRPARFTL